MYRGLYIVHPSLPFPPPLPPSLYIHVYMYMYMYNVRYIKHTSAPVTFSVMSYNVLCDKYATRQQYGYCPTWALAWDYRKAIIMKELLDLTPDIIALQVIYLSMYMYMYMCSSVGRD